MCNRLTPTLVSPLRLHASTAMDIEWEIAGRGSSVRGKTNEDSVGGVARRANALADRNPVLAT